jgi:hypothetical protein
MRESHVVLLHPPAASAVEEDAWVSHTEYDVRYNWDITRVMFSRGNVNERRRARGDPLSMRNYAGSRF